MRRRAEPLKSINNSIDEPPEEWVHQGWQARSIRFRIAHATTAGAKCNEVDYEKLFTSLAKPEVRLP